MCAAGDEAGKMRHVDVEQGANFLGNGRHALEINFPGIGRTAGNQQFGGYVGGNFFDRVIIEQRSEERRVGKECRCGWSPNQ